MSLVYCFFLVFVFFIFFSFSLKKYMFELKECEIIFAFFSRKKFIDRAYKKNFISCFILEKSTEVARGI